MLTIGSLFSGIGGLELGLEMAGLGPVVWQVENDPFCRNVLAARWPNVERFADVEDSRPGPADIISGGFPCQDVSSAGKGAGLAGRRSGLWFEFARIVSEIRPQYVIVENVASGARRWVDDVCESLERIDYETIQIPLSAQDVGAPHLRRRIFIVAHTERHTVRDGPERQPGRPPIGVRTKGKAEPLHNGDARAIAHAASQGLEKWQGSPVREPARRQEFKTAERMGDQGLATGAAWDRATDGSWRPTVAAVCRVDDGIPDRMDRLRSLGNAVVPQCAEVVGWIIRELETKKEPTQ